MAPIFGEPGASDDVNYVNSMTGSNPRSPALQTGALSTELTRRREEAVPRAPSVRISFARSPLRSIADRVFALPLDYPDRDC